MSAWNKSDLLKKGWVEDNNGVWHPPGSSSSFAAIKSPEEKVWPEEAALNLLKDQSIFHDNPLRQVFEGANGTLIATAHPERYPELNVPRGRPSKNEEVFVDLWKPWKRGIVIVLIGKLKGLNNDLLQKHWSQHYRDKKAFLLRLQLLKVKPITGKLQLTYMRYAARPLDWDNMCSTMKKPLDAIVKAGIIEDDSFKIITKFIPEQRQCRGKDARMEFYFEPI